MRLQADFGSVCSFFRVGHTIPPAPLSKPRSARRADLLDAQAIVPWPHPGDRHGVPIYVFYNKTCLELNLWSTTYIIDPSQVADFYI